MTLKLKEDDLIGLEITRVEDGIILEIVSPDIEQMFQKLAAGHPKGEAYIADDHYWKGKKFYRLPEDFPKFEGLAAINSKHTLKMHKGTTPNMSFLRRVGIGEGKKLLIPGMYTDDDIREWLEMARIRAIELLKAGEAYLEKKAASAPTT